MEWAWRHTTSYLWASSCEPSHAKARIGSPGGGEDGGLDGAAVARAWRRGAGRHKAGACPCGDGGLRDRHKPHTRQERARAERRWRATLGAEMAGYASFV